MVVDGRVLVEPMEVMDEIWGASVHPREQWLPTAKRAASDAKAETPRLRFSSVAGAI